MNFDVGVCEIVAGFTALFKAAEKGHDKCVKTLLRAGAKSSKYDLIAATLNGHEKCVHLLLKEGADVNGKPEGTPIVIHTAEEGHDRCLDLLIQAGADVNATGATGDTALIKAARNGFPKCVNLLIKAGANVNQVNHKSCTALMKAAGNIRDKVKSGRNITLMADNVQTGATLSIQCVKLLLKAGAHVNKVNQAGLTALTASIVQNDGYLEELTRMLFAAGDTIDGAAGDTIDGAAGDTIEGATQCKHRVWPSGGDVTLPEHLLELIEPRDIRLMDLCRRTIRNHLLQMSTVNLFCRIPLLGIPSLLSNYLLYNVSLSCTDDYNDRNC